MRNNVGAKGINRGRGGNQTEMRTGRNAETATTRGRTQNVEQETERTRKRSRTDSRRGTDAEFTRARRTAREVTWTETTF
ncbi:hypothetical protein R1flu_001029 [Riccia fluitans]|uniref:Uncharacterized protein n=1 Tax=Riccia fluitans TaxID=41844 RepID=A0ABD1Y658_9MARC